MSFKNRRKKKIPKKIIPTCSCCGEPFIVELVNGNKIPDNVFYGGKSKAGVGNWMHSQLKFDSSGNAVIDKNGNFVWEKINPWYIELKYKLMDNLKLLFHRYEIIEYWECPKCYKEINGEK